MSPTHLNRSSVLTQKRRQRCLSSSDFLSDNDDDDQSRTRGASTTAAHRPNDTQPTATTTTRSALHGSIAKANSFYHPTRASATGATKRKAATVAPTHSSRIPYDDPGCSEHNPVDLPDKKNLVRAPTSRARTNRSTTLVRSPPTKKRPLQTSTNRVQSVRPSASKGRDRMV